ncbi:MAG: T9SS type A sorting domain-containing protein [Chitinophagales bacterium]|jgi:hypothetical protein|nr:T9SS type A sorting domain-containing protein [Bacteroidota bacterium]MBK7569525.1 T9SS type A sorting domain-containing protein [Bacteroidota bacterium]MBP9220983.1 T9SS type A sorting domain-containing protein [Chitinophagales bacterium]MBP9794632.1 T9SS type A sorting domain-containing protein [Chitinophagales bacterium]
MHKTLLCAVFLLITPLINAQSLVLAKQFHGNDAQMVNSLAVDNDDNIFSNVNFWDDVDVNPGPGTLNFNSFGSQDVAIVKLNSSGDFVWGIQLGGVGFQTSSVVKTDDAGNVFIFGYFNGTMDMDPGAGVYNLVSAGSDDIFCGKYNASGALVWAVKIGGTGTEQNYGFDLDSNGDPFLFGYFQNTVDFNPEAGTFNLTAGVSGSDFLLKLNNDGTFNYALLMSSFYGNYMTIAPDNNIYFTGLFWGTVDFNPGVGVNNLTAAGFDADCFVLKLNNSGIYQWAGKISGNNSEQGTTLDYDATTSSIVVGGFFEGTIDTDPGGGIHNVVSAGYVDAFVVKLNASTGAFIWGNGFGGLGYQQIGSLKINASGKIHMAGVFEQTSDFDPSVATYNLTSNGYTDIFKLEWNNDGTFSTVEKIGGTLGDWGHGLILDNTGADIICGYFDATVDFDPGADVFNMSSDFTGWDGFLAKYCTTYTINNDIAICDGDSYFAGGAFQTEPGEYYDYYTPVEGCDSIVITHLSINSPVVNLGPNTTICSGEILTLDAENIGATYLWSTGATTQTINVSATGTYSVTITDASGCTAFDVINVTVNPAPNVNLGADIIVCSGETVILNAANPGSTYLWNTGATTQTINVIATGNYSVVVTNGFSCTDSDLIHVTINPTPVVNIGNNIQICENEGLILDAENVGSDYLWSTGAITQTIFVNSSAVYSVEVTNIYGCSASDNVNIIANPAPFVDLGDDINFCDGGTVIFDATNPLSTYLWSTGSTGASITVTEEGIYSVTVTNNFGCSETDEVEVTIDPSPVVDLGADIGLCNGDTLILNATNPASTYLWSTGAISSTIMVSDAGTYSVLVTNIAGCTATDDINVNLNPTPFVDLGDDIAVCEGETVLLNATTIDCTYLWSTGENSATISTTEAGIYSVEVTNIYGCSFTDIINIDVVPIPVVDLGEDVSFCDGGSVVFDATNPGCTYLWSTGETSSTITVTDAGIYSVIVNNILGCNETDEVEVGIYTSPVVDLGPDIISCDNVDVILDATTPLCTYAWSTGEDTETIIVDESGTYSVIVTNSFSCTDTDEIFIELLEAPVIEFILPEIICSDVEAFELTATPSGGTYSGDGISDNIFDPLTAGLGNHIITYTFTDVNGCTSVSSQEIEVTICQAIDNIINNVTINIFPNPAISDITISISNAEEVERIEIFDLLGNKLISEQVNGIAEMELFYDISDIPSGTYLIYLKGNSEFYSRSFIISR